MGISRIARECSTRNQEGLAPSSRGELLGTPVWVKYPSLPRAGARERGVAQGGNVMRKSIVFTFVFMFSLLLGASYVPAGFAEEVRKDIAKASPEERKRFRDALIALHTRVIAS